MNEIKCQACTEESRKKGCYRCGGAGIVLREIKCDLCERTYWTAPVAYTSYEGKQWTSFDGLVLIDHKGSRSCVHCERERKLKT
jgi:hypothetical protein